MELQPSKVDIFRPEDRLGGSYILPPLNTYSYLSNDAHVLNFMPNELDNDMTTSASCTLA